MYQNKHLMSNQNNIPKIEKIAVAPRNDQARSLGIEKNFSRPSHALLRKALNSCVPMSLKIGKGEERCLKRSGPNLVLFHVERIL